MSFWHRTSSSSLMSCCCWSLIFFFAFRFFRMSAPAACAASTAVWSDFRELISFTRLRDDFFSSLQLRVELFAFLLNQARQCSLDDFSQFLGFDQARDRYVVSTRRVKLRNIRKELGMHNDLRLAIQFAQLLQ